MKKIGDWTQVSSEVKYKSPWIEVREDKVIRPDGGEGVWSVVEKLPGVTVLAMDDDGYVYLTVEFKYTMGANGIECVNGAIDEGETPLEAAERELKEELGITADEWKDLGLVDPFTANIHSPAYIFLARKLHFGETDLDDGEVIAMKKVAFNEAVDMVMKSKMTHGPGCVAILKTKLLLDSQGV